MLIEEILTANGYDAINGRVLRLRLLGDGNVPPTHRAFER